MRPLTVNGHQLEHLAAALLRLAGRLEDGSSGLLAAARAAPADQVARLAAVLRRRTDLIDRLRLLARVVALAGHVYADVESALVSGFAGLRAPAVLPGWLGSATVPAAAEPHLLDVLVAAPPDELEALLVASPALAAVVVASGGRPAPGSDAARLATLLGAGRGSEGRVRAFLTGLSGRRLAVLALLHPALLAGVRSAPLAARYSANRVRVAADLHGLLTRIGSAPPGRERRVLGRAVAQRREWLSGAVSLHRSGGRVERRRHQLLWFDPRADGQVVEVLGDLDRAEHLAVFVPGTGSDLSRYPGSLARMVPFAAADPHLAVVLWQGADFPDQPFDDGVLPLREHVVAAAYRDAADRAGPLLAADVAGLRLAAPRAAADLTVLGHSYGGSVVGSALQHGLVADRVVHVASAGAYADHPSPVAGTQVFSMTAFDDPIRLAQGHDVDDAPGLLRAASPPALAPEAVAAGAALRWSAPGGGQIGHGADPDGLPGVIRLATGRYDDSCRLVRGHSGMFAPGTTAWRNLLATMTARPVEVVEPQRWSSHLEPWSLRVDGSGLHARPPHYVVDRTPWSGDPGYVAPLHPTR